MPYIFKSVDSIHFHVVASTGKKKLSQCLASHVGAVHLRIDTIEQALRDLCGVNVEGEGYRLAYRVAADNIRLGLSVIADSCNPIALTRREWEEVAESEGADFVNIEVTCSNMIEHRRRVETRRNSVSNLKLPTWEQVTRREYHFWDTPRITIDTAGCSPDESFSKLSTLLQSQLNNLEQ